MIAAINNRPDSMYIIFLWDIALIIARVCLIYRRGNPRKSNSPIKKLIPFFEIIALALFCVPYALSAFLVKFELIEFSAGVFFIEAASWELFIYIGLVPVNTCYEEVFERSTVNMNPTCTRCLPVAISASTISLQSSDVVQSGFSQNTGLPALTAAITASL